ncbi:MAG: isochorismatase family protein [Thermoplasmata archaeon]
MGALLNKLGFEPGDRLYIAGLQTNCCDKHTAARAWFRGYLPVMLSDCAAAFDDPEGVMGMEHEEALRYEQFWYDAKVLPSAEVLKELGESISS